ncbi:AMSH-like ubiquitin thioesterase 3 [Sesamum angolense]|uniref:AMSH-like ubiquitin thioesterase 3 n=1 Tax=Sesamum angolense TaxID=2727404 RepID=A0AAE2BK86_9LAMI|nr:AMSH-like ubiquitin thioesterase 3 [Sesamum angolense]
MRPNFSILNSELTALCESVANALRLAGESIPAGKLEIVAVKMRRPGKFSSRFNFNSMTLKVEVEYRISLRMCLDGGHKFVDSYAILLRLNKNSLVSKTMPHDRDYQPFLCPKDRTTFRKVLQFDICILWVQVGDPSVYLFQSRKHCPGIHFRAKWFLLSKDGASAEIKLYQVNPPTNIVMDSGKGSSVNQVETRSLAAIEDCDSEAENSTMDSLDEGRWLHAAEESGLLPKNELENNDIQWGNIRQPMPPPVLAQVHPELLPICPSGVSHPTPGSSRISEDGLSSSISYQDLHIRNRVFHITTLIIPKQESTSDSTHPTQTCFMSSVDLHTHYSYQVMLPEAIAIVMAPTDTSSPHGIFHLCDPAGVAVIRNCQQRGFHPHQAPQDGSPIYEHCSHVYMNANLMFDVVDLR